MTITESKNDTRSNVPSVFRHGLNRFGLTVFTKTII